VNTTDFLVFMANQTAGYSVGSWEDLVGVTFDMGALEIRLESEEGGEVAIPCDDLMELYRLAQISYGLAEGCDVRLKWEVPVLSAEGIEEVGQ
jgi:hypothetical protein